MIDQNDFLISYVIFTKHYVAAIIMIQIKMEISNQLDNLG